MHISDLIFGDFEINEPVLLELLNSKELKRLNQISSAGYYPAEVSYGNPQGNRWFHSVGVFLLLRRFGASLEEQIAGLIHDVSHSAFSHTIDYIKKDLEQQKVQSAQDNIHDDFVKNSSLKPIIEKYGFDLDYILDDSHFLLKENDLPDICADRLDYTLRQSYMYGLLNLQEIRVLVDSLCVADGAFAWSNIEAARKYAYCFRSLNDNCWSGITSAVMFSVSAKMFRRALEKGYVRFSDFYAYGDNDIISMIEPHLAIDAELARYYNLLRLTPDHFANVKSPEIEPVYIKNRIVDPKVVTASGIMRFSLLDEAYRREISALPKSKEYYILPKDYAEAV